MVGINDGLSKELFSCGFQGDAVCPVKMSGKDWELKTSLSFLGQSDNYYEVVLNPGEKSEIVFSEMVQTPSRGVACLTFRYKKFYSGQTRQSPPLQVLAWPFKGRPGRVNILRSSPTESTWIRAQVTFRKIDNFFLVVFRGTAPSGKDQMMLAIDDVTVTEGKCAS